MLGWTASFEGQRPVDADGEPVPWMSYAAIHLLKTRLPSEVDVFEYGSGQSTRFFAARARRVVSVEHDADWAAEVARNAPQNVQLMHIPLGDDYVNAGQRVEAGSFDLVVVDGRKRVRCALQGQSLLSSRGVLILDDAERPYYEAASDALQAAGMRRLDCFGLAPGSLRHRVTSFYYRDRNVLGL